MVENFEKVVVYGIGTPGLGYYKSGSLEFWEGPGLGF